MYGEFLGIALDVFNNLNVGWALILLLVRYTGLMMTFPGIGMGVMGLTVRAPAIMVFAMVTLCPIAGSALPLPLTWLEMILQLITEFAFGFGIGLIPTMILGGLQMAGMLSSTTMGLGAGNLMDPSLGAMSSDLSRIYSDTAICLFLLMGGHHVLFYGVAGLGGEVLPGSIQLSSLPVEQLVGLGAHVFEIGVMVSAPVIVALLLTQFVMGLITKAVPTVNVFVVSFPITLLIGFALTMLALPEVIEYVRGSFSGVDDSVANYVGTVMQGSTPSTAP